MWDELLRPMEKATQAVHAWAVAEVENGGSAPISHGLPGAARDMADLLAARAEAVLIGKDVEGLTNELVSRELTGSTWCHRCCKS